MFFMPFFHFSNRSIALRNNELSHLCIVLMADPREYSILFFEVRSILFVDEVVCPSTILELPMGRTNGSISVHWY